MTDALFLIAAIATVAWCTCTHPARAHCGHSLWISVHREGDYECRPALGDLRRDIDDARDRIEIHDWRVVRGRVWCRAGEQAVVVDERTVACR